MCRQHRQRILCINNSLGLGPATTAPWPNRLARFGRGSSWGFDPGGAVPPAPASGSPCPAAQSTAATPSTRFHRDRATTRRPCRLSRARTPAPQSQFCASTTQPARFAPDSCATAAKTRRAPALRLRGIKAASPSQSPHAESSPDIPRNRQQRTFSST